MCGVIGQLGTVSSEPDGWLRSALTSLQHRGPDDWGTWSDPERDVWLGHRRLSILDLSVGGHQPMVSVGGRIVLTFNGEIYNHRAVAAELAAKGVTQRSNSDTEVLANAIEHWGVEAALRRSTGMFAFGAWDRTSQRLHLARDRVGEKPLFVQRSASGLRFASELKALLADGRHRPSVDRRSLASFLRFGYVPTPTSIFHGVEKVEPATFHTYAFDRGTLRDLGSTRYWTAPAFEQGVAGDLDELESRISDAVRLQLQADVPVGTFLSGGIDSSLIVALAATHTERLRTFTVGFEEAGFDESAHAEAVARHLGTAHTTVQLGGDDALAIIPRLPQIYDEPVADPTVLPTRLMVGVARRDVTVALTGDGGDELFAGYARYDRLRHAAPLRHVPKSVGVAIAATVHPFASNPRFRTVERTGLAIGLGGAAGLYEGIMSLVDRPSRLVGPVEERLTAIAKVNGRGDTLVHSAMDADLLTYLPDEMLVKVDRASMDVSLEVRSPLLDPSVIAWSRAHPVLLSRGDRPKAPLRALLHRHVPAHLVDRPKTGFSVPIGAWLRGELGEWAGDLLAPSMVRQFGLLRPEPIAELWSSHRSGAVDASLQLWPVLMFQAWCEEWLAPS